MLGTYSAFLRTYSGLKIIIKNSLFSNTKCILGLGGLLYYLEKTTF